MSKQLALLSSFVFALALAPLAACSSNGLAPITGSVTATYVSPQGGDVTQPFDTSNVMYTAYAQDADGNFTAYPATGGTGSSDGTFTIPGVPDGPFLLEIVAPTGTTWDSLDGLTRDLTSTTAFVGRTDAVPATKDMSLELVATALDAWNDGDQLIANCWGGGTQIDDVATTLMPALTAGATSFDGSFVWNHADKTADAGHDYSLGPTGLPYLMDPTEGDGLVVSRLEDSTTADGVDVLTLTQSMSSAGVAQVDGATATATGAFTEVAQTSLVNVDLDFDSLGTALGSPATRWDVSLVAGPATSVGFTLGPTLLDLSQAAGSATFSGSASISMPYGDPFESDWPVVASATFSGSRSIPFPGATAPLVVPISISTIEGIAAGGTFTLDPVALPSGATLNGIPIDERYVAWDGTTPLVFTVVLPAGAAGFEALLVDASVQNGVVATAVPIAIDASSNAIVLPPTIFTSGHYYTLQIASSTPSSSVLGSTGKILIGPQSASVCGDGVVDPTINETCDDGNTTSGDGCSATCQTE